MQFLRRLFASTARRPAASPETAAQTALRAFGLLQQGDSVSAAAALAPLLSASTPNADVLFVAALIHKSHGEHAAAAHLLRQTVELRDELGAAWSELGSALAWIGDVESAAAALERAATLEPGAAAIHQNLGYMRYRLRDVSGAIDALTTALALDPGLNDAQFNLAEALLAAGDFERGWAHYETRAHLDAAMQRVGLPRWRGEPGARLAVVAEQGFGDVILFARLLPRLRSMAASVCVFTYARLVPLFEGAQLADDVRSLADIDQATPERYDGYVPFMSLAHVTALRPHEIDPAPYLDARPDDAPTWRTRVGPRDGSLKVGLVWAGNPAHPLDFDRSIPLASLAPLFGVPGVTMYSLQVGADVSAHPELPMIDLTSHFTDAAQTAALLKQLDLVIAVDTLVAHLAGALGVPLWLLCPLRADWRWEIDGKVSPWYRSARIFRPQVTAQWSAVIEALTAALRAHAAAEPPR
jgi:tetratricopeptide (TPR) repeat protein